MKRQITLVALCFGAALAAGCANRTGTMGGPGGYSAGSQPNSVGATAAPPGMTTPGTGTPPGDATRPSGPGGSSSGASGASGSGSGASGAGGTR